MKNRLYLISASCLLASCLAGCGGSYTPPTGKAEKVQTAFNGVEKSLKQQKSAKKSAIRPKGKYNEADALTLIYNSMNVKEESSNPNFAYDEPPMIQFQYLKALYEEIGSDYVFNQKYTENFKGQLYYDFSSREAKKEEAYRYDYSFDFSFSINIDANDLITAKVLFDIDYSRSDDTRHQVMYAEMNLDYDMNEAEPTYTFVLKDLTDLLDAKKDDEKYMSVEYDYVKVDKGAIQEWRKFGICAPSNIENYKTDGFVSKFSVLRAFKDNKVYVKKQNFSPELKSALLEGMDLVGLISNYPTYKAINGVTHPKIKTVIERFNSIYGEEFINHIVYTGATEDWTEEDDSGGSEGGVAGVNLTTNDESVYSFPYTLKRDGTFQDAFTSAEYWDEHIYPMISWNNDKGERLYKDSNISAFKMYFADINDSYNTIEVSPSTRLSAAFKSLHSSDASIILIHAEHDEWRLDMPVTDGCNLMESNVFPREYTDRLGWISDYVPSYPSLPLPQYDKKDYWIIDINAEEFDIQRRCEMNFSVYHFADGVSAADDALNGYHTQYLDILAENGYVFNYRDKEDNAVYAKEISGKGTIFLTIETSYDDVPYYMFAFEPGAKPQQSTQQPQDEIVIRVYCVDAGTELWGEYYYHVGDQVSIPFPYALFFDEELTQPAPSEFIAETSLNLYYSTSQAGEDEVGNAIRSLIGDESISIPAFSGGGSCEVIDPVAGRIGLTGCDAEQVNDYLSSFVGQAGFVQGAIQSQKAYLIYRNNALIQIYFEDLTNTIIIHKEAVTFSLIGSYTSWSFDGMVFFQNLNYDKKEGRFYFECDLEMKKQEKFKIVKNSTWDDGGYGYAYVVDAPEYVVKMDGNDDNIGVTASGLYNIRLYLELDWEGGVFVYALKIEKQ